MVAGQSRSAECDEQRRDEDELEEPHSDKDVVLDLLYLEYRGSGKVSSAPEALKQVKKRRDLFAALKCVRENSVVPVRLPLVARSSGSLRFTER